jgi:hypothetical protein
VRTITCQTAVSEPSAGLFFQHHLEAVWRENPHDPIGPVRPGSLHHRVVHETGPLADADRLVNVADSKPPGDRRRGRVAVRSPGKPELDLVVADSYGIRVFVVFSGGPQAE